MLVNKSYNLLKGSVRCFATSSFLCGRKTLEPFDKRWGLHVTQAGPENKGGSEELKEKLLRGPNMPCRPYIYLKDGRSIFVKEMVPDFIVPDLKGFKLKPYVSYGVKNIKQAEFTAKNLFDATYGSEMLKDLKDDKIDVKILEDKIAKLKGK